MAIPPRSPSDKLERHYSHYFDFQIERVATRLREKMGSEEFPTAEDWNRFVTLEFERLRGGVSAVSLLCIIENADAMMKHQRLDSFITSWIDDNNRRLHQKSGRSSVVEEPRPTPTDRLTALEQMFNQRKTK
jgi:hypothetical protein